MFWMIKVIYWHDVNAIISLQQLIVIERKFFGCIEMFLSKYSISRFPNKIYYTNIYTMSSKNYDITSLCSSKYESDHNRKI